MARDFVIFGPALVRVKFGGHVSGNLSPLASGQPYSPSSAISGSTQVYDLGMTTEPIRIRPRVYHRDVQTNDFAQLPADILAELGECAIALPLIHYDPFVLDACWGEALGGEAPPNVASLLPGAGTPIGRGLPAGRSGCHFVGLNVVAYGPPLSGGALNLANQTAAGPWFFPATVLMPDAPFDLPVGAHASLTQVAFRAIPYNPPAFSTTTISGAVGLVTSGALSQKIVIAAAGEFRSSGAVLVQHTFAT